MATATSPLLLELLARGPASSTEMVQSLGVSQPTLSRLLRHLEGAGRIVRMGSGRATRYGLARDVGAAGRAWPLYLINDEGTPDEVASVNAIARERYFVRGGPQRIQDSFEGLPYY